ncbi:hypothetical protein E2986_13052 [Frieseomelitta varia]|uniref:Uncharacterized protein n=1 Tax=Frieseomelitta varia TaxID=561572 RepID=A0A833RNH3_9HYME|nr:hypothetical protein E2986_13052 [Frieseomelitta varia]
MDTRKMSNWNVLSMEAALQQLNNFDEDKKEVTKRSNTVSRFPIYFIKNFLNAVAVIISSNSLISIGKRVIAITMSTWHHLDVEFATSAISREDIGGSIYRKRIVSKVVIISLKYTD